jgi:hypothetical protein
MPRRFAAALALAILATLGVSPDARAQPGAEIAGPTDPVAVAATPAPEGSQRTHGLFFPTGHLLEPGQVQGSVRAYVVFHQLAVGVHERVELSVDAILFLGAGAGGRVSLLPRSSPLKLVAEARLWALIEGPAALQLGGTAGYQQDRLNLHANFSEMPVDGERLYAANAGIVHQSLPWLALGADLGSFHLGDSDFRGLALGVKIGRRFFDIDIMMLIDAGSEDAPIVPLINLTGRS